MNPWTSGTSKAFIWVADAGAFRRAAAGTGVRQSTLSRRVQRLEDRIGVSLFERRSDGVQLTHAGSDFLRRSRDLMADLDTAILTAGAAGAGAIGRLGLGAITSFSHGPQRSLVVALLDRMPNVTLAIVEGERAELVSFLKDRRLDVVILPGLVTDGDFDTLPLWTEKVVVALADDHQLARKGSLRWADLVAETFITMASEPGPEIHDYLIRKLADIGRSPTVARHKVGRETLLNMVGMGLGMTAGAESWTGAKYRGVAFLPVKDDEPPLTFSLIWSPQNDNPVLRRFLSLARVLAKSGFDLVALSRSPDPSP